MNADTQQRFSPSVGLQAAEVQSSGLFLCVCVCVHNPGEKHEFSRESNNENVCGGEMGCFLLQ